MTMEIIYETLQTQVALEVDICVVGGSCTGIFAAVHAARLGANVALIENNGFFGGVATASLVTIWHSLLDVECQQQIIGGLTLEVIERLKQRNAVTVMTPPLPHKAYVFNPEELKLILDELVSENKIHPFLHARFVTTENNCGQINAVIIEDKSGRRAIKAKYFIDATGDGDLVARAGLPFTVYEQMQPPTTVAIFDNFMSIMQHNPNFDLATEIHNVNKYPYALKHGYLWGCKVAGREQSLMIAGTRVNNAYCANADQLTMAEIECRRQVGIISKILHAVPGGEHIALANLATVLGVRETRHVNCLYQVTKDDVLNGQSFTDAIAYGTYGVDIHHSDKPGATMQYLDGTQSYFEPGKPHVNSRWRDASAGVTPYYQIPYRSLIPQGANNLLVAGRMIGATQAAAGALRVMVNCNQTGEAAGVAATLALRNNCNVKDISVSELQKTMRMAGSIIP